MSPKKKFIEYLSKQDFRCTGWPNKLPFGLANWKKCCVSHDYRCAEASYLNDDKLRYRADRLLRNCANKVFPLMGEVMFIGVRSFNLFKKLRGKPEY